MAVFAIAGLLLAGAGGAAGADTGPAVKKSQSGVCHGQDSVHYERTQKFTAYDSMEACEASGGRETRGARKVSPWRWVMATAALIALGLVGWLWMRKPSTGKQLDELERRRWDGHRRQ